MLAIYVTMFEPVLCRKGVNIFGITIFIAGLGSSLIETPDNLYMTCLLPWFIKKMLQFSFQCSFPVFYSLDINNLFCDAMCCPGFIFCNICCT